MLTESELRLLMLAGETDRVERTTSAGNKDKLGQAICAFANDLPHHRKPGYILVGVSDDGCLCGLKATDELLKDLGGIRSDGNVLPQPVMSVSKFSFHDGDVAVVEVFPSDLPPVQYRGRVYIRVGPRKAVANEQDERVLSERRVATARTFDAQPCLEATIDDLDVGLFAAYRREAVHPDVIESNHRDFPQQLAALRFFDSRRGCPTHAGILLFGKKPRYFLPGAYIQYLRFPGAHPTGSPLDQAEISGDLGPVMRELELRARALIQTRMVADGGFHEKLIPSYPEWALRELLMNALMHRSYESNTPVQLYAFSNRIEIRSPGGLYGEVTAENFPAINSYRNPVIAEAMKNLGFVNRFGYGVEHARALLAHNGNRAPVFRFDAGTVSVQVFARPE